ncbi:uncharacterized protein LOC119598342 [Penaeus monodon]|uniref:uncharacterized protein LOC119598342 n=1 Tax=Penaeus monodon TaxID=6687 RepID=UPI0018A752B0|nr:uncharacterized protein LOC119598342 [Penaeus monodon]
MTQRRQPAIHPLLPSSGRTSLWTKQPHSRPVLSLSTSDSTPPEAEIRVAQHLQRRKGLVRSVTACQTSKILRHTEMGPGSFHQPQRRFAHIHVDIVGPLPPSGHRYLFTVVDRSTRWPEAIPMFNASSASCAAALLSGWISRFGIPAHVTSNRGTSFTSQLWTSLGQLLGTSIHHTTAYNPEAKGMVERFHRTLKADLMSRCSNSVDDIARPTGHPNTVTSPKIYARRSMFSSTPTPTTPPLTLPCSGPYEVIERKEKAFLLRIKGANDWISIDRLKPAYLHDDDPPPVRFSRAGRPLSHTMGHLR